MDKDAEIFRQVAAELKVSPLLHFSRLHLHVHEGVVTISGRVNSLAQRQAAERAAARVAGIKHLILEIRAAVSPVTITV